MKTTGSLDLTRPWIFLQHRMLWLHFYDQVIITHVLTCHMVLLCEGYNQLGATTSNSYAYHLFFLYLNSQDPILTNMSYSVLLYILSLQHMLWLKSWTLKYEAVMIFIHHSQQLWYCQGTAFIELNLKSLWLNIPSWADTVQLRLLWVAANALPLMF